MWNGFLVQEVVAKGFKTPLEPDWVLYAQPFLSHPKSSQEY